jgi:hypothetical protein
MCFLFFEHFVESCKALGILFYGTIVLIIMAFIFYVRSIKKLNGNDFHTWDMKMEFLLHQKDLWEIASRKLLPPKVEFRKIVLEGSILEHCYS